MGKKKWVKRVGKREVELEESPQWRYLCATMGRHFIVYDTDYVHVVMGTVFANRLDDDPVWLYLAGQPSAGKTILIEPLDGHDSIRMISRWTESTMVSGRGKVGGKDDASLAPELDGKMLLVKDLTSALSMNRNTAHAIMGELRDAFDGKISKAFGVKNGPSVIKSYAVRFGMIAGVTHAIDKHQAVLGELGERFLLYRMRDMPKALQEEACLRVMRRESGSQVAEEMRGAAHAVLDQDREAPRLTEEQMGELKSAAMLAAKLRAQVPRHYKTHEVIDQASEEAPMRLAGQLARLAVGMSWAKGYGKVHPRDVNRAKKVAMHGCTRKRKSLIEYLLGLWCADEIGGVDLPLRGWRTLDEVMEGWEYYSREHVRCLIEDLVSLGIAEEYSFRSSKGRPGKRYRITDDEGMRGMLDVLRFDPMTLEEWNGGK